ncbi:MAG: hypothetical protein U0Y68_07030 [Blastocatellia bacterium]
MPIQIYRRRRLTPLDDISAQELCRQAAIVGAGGKFIKREFAVFASRAVRAGASPSISAFIRVRRLRAVPSNPCSGEKPVSN